MIPFGSATWANSSPRMVKLIDHQYYDFWSCMDILNEKNMLEELWNSGKAPWKIWWSSVREGGGVTTCVYW
jgi:hypothetical protein